MISTKHLIAAFLICLGFGNAMAQSDMWGNRIAASRSSVGQTGNVMTGTVVAARRMTIESEPGYVGTGAGAAVGAAIGSNIGGGRGQLLGALMGAVAGGGAGNAIERRVNQSDGVELVVRLDDGRTVGVIQDADYAYAPGLKVYVLTYGRGVRVSPM